MRRDPTNGSSLLAMGAARFSVEAIVRSSPALCELAYNAWFAIFSADPNAALSSWNDFSCTSKASRHTLPLPSNKKGAPCRRLADMSPLAIIALGVFQSSKNNSQALTLPVRRLITDSTNSLPKTSSRRINSLRVGICPLSQSFVKAVSVGSQRNGSVREAFPALTVNLSSIILRSTAPS